MEERRSVEVTAKSVDEAIETALKRLDADREQVETEILAEGSRGLLGFGGEDAKVRVTLTEAPKVLEEKEEKRPVLPDGDAAEIALVALRNLVRYMGVDAEVILREPSEDEILPVVLDVEGDDLGILIGRQGETLRDLQYVTRLIVSRKLQRWVNVVVDVGGYKRRRQRVLTELAERMAERVVADGKPVSLEPMPAHERRIVHLALRDDEAVRTESTGEGSRRKVVILPEDD